ncbi:ABC transporter permease [Leucobacter sp. W1038]|uniref:ABC transporter permease n=1 Tax=Leucobacter sp. W1038 TaxID=3438281 RepID=UPI003D9670D8
MNTEVPTQAVREKVGGNKALDWIIQQFGFVGPLPVLLVGVFVYFAVTTPTFATANNLTELAQRSVFLVLMAMGQMLVLVSGGFDLSIAAVVSFASIVSAQVMVSLFTETGNEFLSMMLSLGFTVLIGIIIGLVNGIGVAILKINAFIVTLAVATIIGGLTIIVSGGVTVTGLPPLFARGIASDGPLGISWMVYLTIPVVIAMYFLTNNSVFGTHLYALGDNPVAARIAGIRVERTMIIAYVLGSVLVAYGAWLLTARIGSGQPTLGGSYTMETITAAVIGGASLRGGRGTIIGVVLGVLFMQMLTNGMNLARLDTNSQQIAIGVALLFAVLIDRLRDRARTYSAVRRRLKLVEAA